jgi:ABC-type antimicrobial peptide transport system permease subunit
MEDSRIRAEVKDDFDKNGQLYTISGRHPRHDNEIAITNLVKKEFGKGIGDYVFIKDDKGEGHKFLITGIFQSIEEGGRVIRVSEEGAKALYPDFELNELYIKLAGNADLDTVISDMKSKYTGYTEISNQYNDDEDTKSVTKTAFTAISNLVFILTIFMVVIITILIVKVTIHSETGELGIYKAMGFSSGKLRLQLALRFLLITFLGAVIGGIAEKFTCEPLASSALIVVGLTKLDLGLSLLEALIPMAIVILGSVLAALACSGKIKRISAYELINE